MILEFVDKDDMPIANIESPSNPFLVGQKVELHISNYEPTKYDIQPLSKTFRIIDISGQVRISYMNGSVSEEIIMSIVVE